MRRLTIGVHTCTETLGLLIAMAWADGRLGDAEKQALEGAAEVFSLPAEMRGRLQELLQSPVRVEQLRLARLSDRERAFAYLAAAWMAGLDAGVHPEEQSLLAEIGDALGLSAERRQELDALAKKLEPLPEGTGSWSQEVTKLFRAIPPQLEELGGEDFEVVFE